MKSIKTKEVWKDVEGYENEYQISNFGRVKSIKKVYKNRGELILSPCKCRSYLRVALTKDNKAKNFFVHVLVAKAFVPNPDNLPFVNHKDEKGNNNCASNLEWCTQLYNLRYGTGYTRRGESGSIPICGINVKTGERVYFRNGIEASERGFNNNHISECARGKRKTSNDYKWTYITKEDYNDAIRS